MADFIKVHGMQIAAGGHIKNSVIESLAVDPTSPNAGRIWVNTTDKLFRMATLDADGVTVIIRAFATKEALDAFIASLSATTTDASGAKLIGYDGQVGANAKFSVAAGTLDGALDSIVSGIDTLENTVAAFTGAGGTITILQAEVDQVEAAIGLNTDGTFAPITGSNYLGAASSVINAFILTDTQLKATDTVAQAALPKAGGVMTGNITMSGNIISSLGTPQTGADAATKAYVDGLSAGLRVKGAVKVASPLGVNVTLSGEQTIDGIALVAGDRILVKDNVTQTENGVYVVATGAWTRADDCDGTPDSELVGAYVYVQSGTVNGSTGWVQSTPAPITVGTTSLVFVQFSNAGLLQDGTGLSKNGNVLNINMGAGITILPNDQVGIDIRPSSGLWLTEDGTTDSTGEAAQLAIKTDGNSLVVTAAGIKVSDSFTGNVSELQTQLDNVETAVGLGADGTLAAFSGTNYIDASTSIKAAVINLDGQVKTVAETGIANLKTALNAQVYSFQAGAASTAFIVNHNLNTEMVEVQVWVQDSDGKYRQAVVMITVSDANNILVELSEASVIRAIVRSSTAIA